jgi:hypothetical protein
MGISSPYNSDCTWNLVATELGEGKNRHLAIVSKGIGDRCMTTVAVSTRFTATIA